MFFWLKYGNAQKEIFNINCRSLILMDHISKTCLNVCQKYVDEQLEIVTNSLADIAVNMEELEKQKQEKEQEGDGGDEEGSNSGGAEETEQIAVDDFDPEKVLEQLKALESLRNLQKSALLEAKEKLDGCLPTDLDLATDDGVLKELPALENNSAKAAIEPKSTLNLCRVSGRRQTNILNICSST